MARGGQQDLRGSEQSWGRGMQVRLTRRICSSQNAFRLSKLCTSASACVYLLPPMTSLSLDFLAHRWQLFALSPGTTHAAAVAVARSGQQSLYRV